MPPVPFVALHAVNFPSVFAVLCPVFAPHSPPQFHLFASLSVPFSLLFVVSFAVSFPPLLSRLAGVLPVPLLH